MKINYIETEDNLSGIGHGVEFHHILVTKDTGLFFEANAVAFLEGYAWHKGKPSSVDILIRPVSSPLLRNRGRQPEVIIAEVKEAIDLFKQDPSQQRHGKVTEYVRAWFNA
jgi:hypothetical protein